MFTSTLYIYFLAKIFLAMIILAKEPTTIPLWVKSLELLYYGKYGFLLVELLENGLININTLISFS